jgi:hypothetical protein
MDVHMLIHLSVQGADTGRCHCREQMPSHSWLMRTKSSCPVGTGERDLSFRSRKDTETAPLWQEQPPTWLCGGCVARGALLLSLHTGRQKTQMWARRKASSSLPAYKGLPGRRGSTCDRCPSRGQLGTTAGREDTERGHECGGL